MHRRPRTLVALALLPLSLVAADACRTGGAPRPATPAAVEAPPLPPAQELAVLAASYWESHLEWNPMQATELGDRRFDDRLRDYTPAAREREVAALTKLRARVDAVPAPALPPADRVTRALLLGEIDGELAYRACALDDWSVDARDGLQVGFLRLPELQPVRTPAEGWKLLARWEKMGAAIDQHTANLRRGLAAGKVATADEVRRVLGQLDDLLAKPDEKWPLRAPASARPRRLAAGGAARVHARHRRGDRGRDPARVRAPPGRAARRDPAARPRRRARRDPQRARRRRVLSAPDQGPHVAGAAAAGDPPHRHGGAAAHPRRDGARGADGVRRRLDCPSCGAACARAARAYFNTRAEVETAARKALARAQAAEPRFLGKPPRTPCVVKRIDEFEERDAPIAYYRPAAIDGSRPGTYYVNTYEPETRARVRGRGAGVPRIRARAITSRSRSRRS